jgi:hypothetical protein
MNLSNDLVALRGQLVGQARADPAPNIESRLIALIDALEAAWQRAEQESDWGSYSDKHADMANLAGIQQHLEQAGVAIAAASRHRLAYYRG